MPGPFFVAVVHTPERVRFIAAEVQPERLEHRVAQYVSENAPHVLCPIDAEIVRTFLAANRCQSAIEHYFATVGQRWDKEWLVTHVDS